MGTSTPSSVPRRRSTRILEHSSGRITRSGRRSDDVVGTQRKIVPSLIPTRLKFASRKKKTKTPPIKKATRIKHAPPIKKANRIKKATPIKEVTLVKEEAAPIKNATPVKKEATLIEEDASCIKKDTSVEEEATQPKKGPVTNVGSGKTIGTLVLLAASRKKEKERRRRESLDGDSMKHFFALKDKLPLGRLVTPQNGRDTTIINETLGPHAIECHNANTGQQDDIKESSSTVSVVSL